MDQCDWPGSVGDSVHETARAAILLGHTCPTVFTTSNGFLRHPTLVDKPGWDAADFSNDGLLPYMLARPEIYPGMVYIRGTKTLLSLGCQLIKWRAWRLLNLINIVQGWLLPGPNKYESADYLNYLVIYVFLKRNGKWATLNIPKAECINKVRSYYKPEPNSTWIIDAYERALNS